MNENYINVYQNQIISLLNQYLSNIAVLTNNLYNYHWNIVGPSFFTMHEKFQEYYEETTEMFDVIAELIKQLDGYPIASLSEYNNISQIKPIPSKDYTQIETIKAVINDFEYMIMIGNNLLQYTNQIDNEIISSTINQYNQYFIKQLWMLKAHLK
jgi:starvation-inducible DNA-binding protein